MKFPEHAVTNEAAMTTVLRHAKQMWPFLAGFTFTGYLMMKVAFSVTDEDVKNSKFANPNGHHH